MDGPQQIPDTKTWTASMASDAPVGRGSIDGGGFRCRREGGAVLLRGDAGNCTCKSGSRGTKGTKRCGSIRQERKKETSYVGKLSTWKLISTKSCFGDVEVES
jgi:hypothetical protein